MRIHYERPPHRRDVHVQRLLLDRPDVKVTFAEGVELDGPVEAGGDVILEPGSDVVWFTFPGAWHDVGRFHRSDGTFTGIYANVLTPVYIDGEGRWFTTDLFLDVWVPPGGGEPEILDRDQFDEAVEEGWIDEGTARRARAEAERLEDAARSGGWPPEVVAAWTLERAREAAAEAGTGGS